MKTVVPLLLLLASAAQGFVPSAAPRCPVSASSSTALSMSFDRRAFAKTGFATAIASFVTGSKPKPAAAVGYGGEYKAKFDDLKALYALGVTLDKLKENVSDPDKFEAALVGLRMFNKDDRFYTGYARNYISKSVKNNAEGDPRVGYVKQASKLIGSCQELLEGRQGLEGKAASAEAVSRVNKAQTLIAKFLAESGVEDDRVAAFVSAHP